jgi:uncharacterized small protein (TIGR04563 family)
MPSEKKKQSLYFPEDMLYEIVAEAQRLDRSMSWIVQQAWRLAKGELTRFPSSNQTPTEREAAAFVRGKFDKDPT